MKIVFMGTPAAAVPSLDRLVADGHHVVAVYTQPDRPAGRGNKLRASPVKEFALEHGLSLLQPSKIKTAEALSEFRSHNADIAVVVAYGRILPEPFLDAFAHGAINVHFSLLPKYRGAAPVNWAIANGESETGVTTMKMDAGLDTGDILLQRTTPIGIDETSVELTSRLSQIGAELLSETLHLRGSITPTPQDDSSATFAPILKREDGRIDWATDAAAISNRIRGFQPFPSAWTTFRGEHLAVWKASPHATADARGSAGAIVEAKGDSLIVACREGSYLQIDELQPQGKRRMAARDFINGTRPAVAELLGAEE
jgi:methionyl-tRNA formyltransferase